MMARRLLTALFVAAVISAVSTFALARKLAKPRVAYLRYVTPTRDLDVGEIVTAEEIHVTNWPSSAGIAGALLSPGNAVGRAVLTPLVSGQPIVAKQLSAVGGVGLSAKIPQGMRAISLRSDQVVGVAGFLLPGTHIDVLVTYRNSQNDAITATVLQNAEVLAAGQKTQADPDGKPSTVDVVTLLVTPLAAERVVLASTQGTVHFVLRNGADQKQVDPVVTNVAALGLSGQPATPAGMPASDTLRSRLRTSKHLASANKGIKPAPGYHIIVVRGEKQTEETFQ